MHFIGIDIGTSTVCGVVYNALTKQTTSVTKANTAVRLSPHPWEKIQDARQIVKLAREVVDECRAKVSDIQGIGVTGQMHGIVYIDNEGNAVSPLYTWQDNRGNQPFADGVTCTGYLSARTGYRLATGFGLVTHFYNLRHNLVPETAVKVCTIMDYVVMKLTGRKTPLTDYTNAAGLGFFDLRQLRFDTAALRSVGIDPAILPEVAPSATPAGHYDAIPVCSAIGDNQASFLGTVEEREHSVLVTVGTSSQVSVYTGRFVEVDTLDTRPFPGGGYILVGAALCGGRSLALLNAFFKDTLQLFGGAEISEEAIYRIMSALPYPSGTADLPEVKTLFDGTRFAPEERGHISNLSTTNLTPANLVAGFVRGMARELYDFYSAIPETIRRDKTHLTGSGNAIKKNPLLRQALEEQFSLPLRLTSTSEEAALGAAFAARDTLAASGSQVN